MLILVAWICMPWIGLVVGQGCTSCGYGYCYMNDTTGYCDFCACPEGFSGACCENEAPNPCDTDANICSVNLGQGRCMRYPGGRYQCSCYDGWGGDNCTIAVSTTTSTSPTQSPSSSDEINYCPSGTLPLFFKDVSYSHTLAVNPSPNKTYCTESKGYQLCLNPTNSTDWRDTIGKRYEVNPACSTVQCMMDENGFFWTPQDLNQTGYNLRPFCPNGTYQNEIYTTTPMPSTISSSSSSSTTTTTTTPLGGGLASGGLPSETGGGGGTSLQEMSAQQAIRRRRRSASTPPECGIYAFQNFLYYKSPNWTETGLVYTEDSGVTTTWPYIEQFPNSDTKATPYRIGEYNYLKIKAVFCNTCDRNNSRCTMISTQPRPSTTTTRPLVDPRCTALNCQNGGMCVIKPNDTDTCECLSIYYGPRCQTFAPCAYFQRQPEYMCLNGGTCTSNSSYPYHQCLCPDGYCGDRCEGPCTTIRPTSIFDINNQTQIISDVVKSDPGGVSRNLLPYVLANMTLEEKMNASWKVEDLYMWASFERTELDIYKDLHPWYENSMGNCFTFNHENHTKVYKLRYGGEEGGFKAQLKISQVEYVEWVLTASLLVFFHRREETIMGESVSYQIAPGEETTFIIQRNTYTRLGPPYGICVKSRNDVKSYYNPGSAYTIDSCYRSYYQDYVQNKCGCMDPKYYMAENANGCEECVDNITLTRGEPSTWPECDCPPPCKEYVFDVAWSKTIFKMPLTYVLTSLMNITSLIMGISMIFAFEIIYLFMRIFHVVCMNKEAKHSKIGKRDMDEIDDNVFNNPKKLW